MSSLDQLYYVCGGPFDGNQWPHYEEDKYTIGDGDYLFVNDVWCWILGVAGPDAPTTINVIDLPPSDSFYIQVDNEKPVLKAGFVLTLWAVLVIMMLSATAQAQGIGEHAIGVHSIGSATGDITYSNSGAATGDITNLNNPGKSATLDTPEARLRQAYEYCLTDFKGTQGIVMDGNHIVAASFSDPNCAKISQRWEGSQEQKHYNAELADWNRQRIAREKVLIDQVAGEGQQHTPPMRSRMKQ